MKYCFQSNALSQADTQAPNMLTLFSPWDSGVGNITAVKNGGKGYFMPF